MKNMKIVAKLIFSFSIVILFSIAVGVVGIVGMYLMNVADDGLYKGNYLPTVMAGNISQTIVEQRVYMRNFIIYDVNEDADIFKKSEDSMNKSKTNMETLLRDYKAAITNPEDQATYDEFVKVYNNDWLPLLIEVHTLGTANKSAEAEAALTTGIPAADKMNELTDKLQNVNLSDGQKAVESNTELFTMMTVINTFALVISVSIAMFLAVYIARLIGRPIKKMVTAANAIAIGDLNVDVHYISRDEVGVMAQAFEKMVHGIEEQANIVKTLADGDLTCDAKPRCDRDTMGMALEKLIGNLNEMFGDINNSTVQVSSGSKQIADGAQSLAQGSTEQAAAIEQFSSSINEIANKTQKNAEKAVRAADLSNTIRQNAQKGSEQMNHMMEAVKEINDASNSISKVIKVIDDLAFQTNILALNAAVEAARAGQHGKGFAVVAEEVRNLAAKSAEAAKDTGGLIANSIAKAQLGATIADETAVSLNQIVEGINESTEIVTEIAHSSEDQSADIRQINIGIDQVAQVVQQNSATAQESAAASEEMNGQANMLEELISNFKLKN